MGTLCLLFGGSLIVHGTNNVYENGRNLITGRSDTEGPLRKGYQKLARISGYDDCIGNVAYGSTDLILSAYGAGRLVIKPDSWRLFKYIHTDYIRAYKTTPAGVLAIDLISDGITIDSIIDQWRCRND
ncbi:hypothetical protein PSCICO_05010 [Pseudomonas cichorii]|nr:hypothetical protein PSCICO_05010 [Pseudomonas cichorii]